MNNFLGQLNLLIGFFSNKERKTLILFLIFSLFISLSEVLSISLIFPIFNMIENHDLIINNKFLFFFYNQLNFSNINYFIFGFSSVCIFLMIIVNLFNFLITKNLNKIICRRVSILSNQILNNYVEHKFEFFLSSKKSELLQDVIHEVQLLVFSCLLSLADIFTKFITVFFLLAFLLIIKPYISIVLILVFLLAYYLILMNAKNKAKKYGDERLLLDKERFSIVTDIFNSIQEIKIYNTSKYFIDNYKKVNSKFADISTNQLNLVIVPKYVLESIIYIIFLFFIFAFSSGNLQINNVLPDLIIFGIAAIKIIPLTQQIYSAFTKFKFYTKSLDKISKIHRSFNIDEKNKISKNYSISIPDTFNQIRLDKISYNFSNLDKKILKSISINFNKGDVIGIIGESGSGKTTLVNLISGLLQTNTGEIKLNEISLEDYNKKEYFKSISYVPQNVSILNQSLKDNITFGSSKNFDEEYFKKIINTSNLTDLISQNPEKENFILGETGLKISGGQKQRIGIARALYRKPKILILDESLNALDIENGSKILKNIINDEYADIKIIITHNHEYLKFCNKVIEIKNGEIFKL